MLERGFLIKKSTWFEVRVTTLALKQNIWLVRRYFYYGMTNYYYLSLSLGCHISLNGLLFVNFSTDGDNSNLHREIFTFWIFCFQYHFSKEKKNHSEKEIAVQTLDTWNICHILCRDLATFVSPYKTSLTTRANVSQHMLMLKKGTLCKARWRSVWEKCSRERGLKGCAWQWIWKDVPWNNWVAKVLAVKMNLLTLASCSLIVCTVREEHRYRPHCWPFWDLSH